MNLVKSISLKILHLLEIILKIIMVIGFIIFEELIWKFIAIPVGTWFASLKAFQKLQVKIEAYSAYQTLAIFLVLFGVVEIAGIYAGILLVSGSVITATLLYASKMPLAALTFWIFGFTKDKLLTIDWFASLYGLVIQAFDWVKSTSMYRKVKYSVYRAKRYLKNLKSSGFKEDIARIYRGLQTIFKREADEKPETSKEI